MILVCREVKMKSMPKSFSRSGQTAVFVFILLVVGLTIGLSLSSRTIRDLQGSTGSDLSSRAFAAAEAGVEDALRQNLGNIATGQYTAPARFPTDNQSTYSYKVDKSPSFNQVVSADTAVQLNLKADNGSLFTGNLQIYWVKVSDSVENASGSRPSLEITLVKNNAGTYSLTKYAVNADTRSNNFQNPDGTTQGPVTNSLPNYTSGQGGNQTYANLATVAISSSDKAEAVRIRPLYNKSSITAQGSGLPAQSYVITSQGIAGTSTRVVQVTRSIPALPAIFDYVLFNGSSLPLTK